MSTSNGHGLLTGAALSRGPLRLNLAEVPGSNRLDGGWWPQTGDLEMELADLVDNFPSSSGRIVRARVSPPDWDEPARRVHVADGYLEVDSPPCDNTHMIHLMLSDL